MNDCLLTAIFLFNGPPFLHQKGYNDVIYLECSVLISYAKRACENLKSSKPKISRKACFA